MSQKMSFCVRAHRWWQEGEALEDVASMPSLLRRRINPAGQQTLYAASQMPDIQSSRYIICSRHADFNRTLNILEAVVDDAEVSPSDFSLSSHHVLAGLLSIAHKNAQGHTALASGTESFCYGLMEAAACLAENPDQPILLIYYNILLTAPFDHFNSARDRTEYLVLSLTANEGNRFYFSMQNRVSDKITVSLAQGFYHFLQSNDAESAFTGTTRQWAFTRA